MNLFKFFIIVFVFVSCYKEQEKSMKSLQKIDKIVFEIDIYLEDCNNYNNSSKKLLDGDIIMMSDKKTATLTHAAVFTSKYSDSTNHKIINSILRGICISDLNNILNFNDYNYTIFRYNSTNPKNNKKLRRAISLQAEKWAELLYRNKDLNCYRHKDFYYFLYSKYGSNKSKKQQASHKRNLLTKNEFLKTLFFIKYSLRRNVYPSLNNGLTCSGFIIACLGNAFLEDQLKEFCLENIEFLKKNEFLWPSIKYGYSDCHNNEYRKAVALLNKPFKLNFNKEEYIQFLLHRYPRLNENRLNKYINTEIRVKKNKISLLEFFNSKKVSLNKVIENAKNELGNLKSLNIKTSTLKELFFYLNSNKNIWQKID